MCCIREFSASTFCVHVHVAYFVKRVLNILSLNLQIIGVNQFFRKPKKMLGVEKYQVSGLLNIDPYMLI